MDIHRAKSKAAVADVDLVRAPQLAEKIDEIVNDHHELIIQLFQAERTMADWKKVDFMTTKKTVPAPAAGE